MELAMRIPKDECAYAISERRTRIVTKGKGAGGNWIVI
jgi:hypothetical protein